MLLTRKTAEKKTENENVVEVTPSKGTTPEELAAIQVFLKFAQV